MRRIPTDPKGSRRVHSLVFTSRSHGSINDGASRTKRGVYIHFTAISQVRIIGGLQRAISPVHVACIALLDISQNCLEASASTLRLDLTPPALGTHPGVGGEEDFDARVCTDARTDIATVKHSASRRLCKFPLL